MGIILNSGYFCLAILKPARYTYRSPWKRHAHQLRAGNHYSQTMQKISFFGLSLVLTACTQTVLTPTPATGEDMSRFKPIMFHNVIMAGQEDPYLEGKQKLAEAAERMNTLTDEEKSRFALALVLEYDKELSALGLDAGQPDFITDFALAANSNPEVAQADEDMWEEITDWKGACSRAISQLAPELQKKLQHDYMGALMDCYAAYMIARHAELNEAVPAEQRTKARNIVALIAQHADGEYGHRDTGLNEIEGYSTQKLDVSRLAPLRQGN